MPLDYPLSFTTCAARRPESLIAANLFLELGDWAQVKRAVAEQNLFQYDNPKSSRKVCTEVVKRLEKLSEEEIGALVSVYGDDQAALLWIAICRAYPFVYAFSRDVIATRYEDMVGVVTAGAYEAFFEREANQHSELDLLAETSKKKIRSQVFRMAEECKLLGKGKEILPVSLSPELKKLIGGRRPEDLSLFPGRM